ncbi:MAG: hypothetical protein WD960_06835 [Gemmatimonadota bacterium]
MNVLIRQCLDPQDTLALPDRDVEPAVLTVQVEGMMSRRNVPFWPRALWAFHPDGYWVSTDMRARRSGRAVRGAVWAGARRVSVRPPQRLP